MSIRNTAKKYGLVARGFHWVMALIVLGMLVVGYYMAGLEYSPFKFTLYGWHKSLGLTILALVVLRLLWRGINTTPDPLKTHQKWEKYLSMLIHILLYAGLFGMPLTGWLMSSAGDFPVAFFGLFEMPDVVPKNETLFKILRWLHTAFSYALLGGLFLHMVGAFKHHVFDEDETLKRMGGNVGFAVIGLLLLGISFYLVGQKGLATKQEDVAKQEVVETAEQQVSAAYKTIPDVAEWIIVTDQSHINFEATQSGEVFQGRFERFDGKIYFDPESLNKSRADITIDIASIRTGSDDRDGQAKDSDWFDTTQFSTAFFQSRSFEKQDANRFIAKGYLTIRGATIPVELAFTLNFEERDDGVKTVHMGGGLELNRLDFGIGQGQWESVETIGNPVKIMISVFAIQAP